MKFRRVATLFTYLSIFINQLLWAQLKEDNIVVAQQWENIYEILKRNELEPGVHKKPFIDLNKQKLEGDTLLVAGNTYQLPKRIHTPKPEIKVTPKPKSNTYPIFGKKYAKVPSIDNRLEYQHPI